MSSANGGDGREQSHQSWMASMDEAHANCRQALLQASVDVSDPRRALWPAVPRKRMTQEHQTVAQLHAAVLDYAQHVKPYRNRLAGIWTKQIQPPHKFPDGDELPVVLSELEKWADERYEHTVTDSHELRGKSRRQHYYRVHLPTAYARTCFDKLNDCRERLRLIADPPTPERTVDSAEDAW